MRIPTRFGGTPQPGAEFDLLAALDGCRSVEDEHSPAWISLHGCPAFVLGNVERLLAGSSYSAEDALSVALEYGLNRVNAHPAKLAWAALREEAIGRQTQFEDPADWDLLYGFADKFEFSIPLAHTQPRQRNFRSRPALRDQLHAVAKPLGIVRSTLAQVCILDALAGQPDVLHAATMREGVDAFYARLAKRVRILAAILGAVGITPTDAVRHALAEIES